MNIRRLILFVCMLCPLLSMYTARGQTFPFRTAILTLTTTETEADKTTLSRSKMWIDYEKRSYSIETDVVIDEDHHLKFVTIQTGTEAYLLNMDAKTVQQIPASDQDVIPFEFGGLPEYKRFGGTHVGTDTIAGHLTDIYEYIKVEDDIEQETEGLQTTPSGGMDEELARIMVRSGRQSLVRQWIWRGIDFSLKTIIDYGPRIISTETVQIATDIELPQRVFTIPEGFKLIKDR